MDNDRIIEHLKEICWTPEPEEKKAFFQGLEERGLTARRHEAINHWDFLLRQFFMLANGYGCCRQSYCCTLRESVTVAQETILLP